AAVELPVGIPERPRTLTVALQIFAGGLFLVVRIPLDKRPVLDATCLFAPQRRLDAQGLAVGEDGAARAAQARRQRLRVDGAAGVEGAVGRRGTGWQPDGRTDQQQRGSIPQGRDETCDSMTHGLSYIILGASHHGLRGTV